MSELPFGGRRFERIENVLLCDAVASTNDLAKELVERMIADDSDLPVTAVVTRHQGSGRGRSGRVWASVGENALALSLVVPWPEGPDRIRVPVDAGVALATGLSRTYGLAVKLKWPNDLLVGKRKLGGVLVEARAAADGLGYAIVGIGLNVSATRAELAAAGLPNATSLAAEGVAPEALAGDAALLAILQILDDALAAPPPDLPAAFAAVSAHVVGDRLTVRDADRFSEGAFRGVTADGRLRLDTGGAVESLVSGEIVSF